MRVRYFAYGSNLVMARLRARVPVFGLIGPARLPAMRLTFDKRGSDGSGKANLVEDAAFRQCENKLVVLGHDRSPGYAVAARLWRLGQRQLASADLLNR